MLRIRISSATPWPTSRRARACRWLSSATAGTDDNTNAEERNEKEIAALNRGEAGKNESAASVVKEQRLGFSVANLTSELRKKYGIGENIRGVVIETVDQLLADARAGLKEGDVIEQVKVKNSDFQTVVSVNEFDAIVKSVKKDDSVMLLVARGETTFFTAFTLR